MEGRSILIEAGRIKQIAPHDQVRVAPSTQVIDAKGKYVLPGLMDANVHLLVDLRLENLVRYEDRFEDLITEAAQVALKNGLTTVFDTAGPRRPLISVRNKINSGELTGSRIFCAGWIIGLDGPFSQDFYPKTLEVASSALIDRINAIWVENVGSDLLWMAPEQVSKEVRDYLGKGVDFMKYASSDHRGLGPALLAFSPLVQTHLVEEARRAGITAQAHTTSVESLRIAIEAGVDIIQHCNITGPTPIPHSTLELLVKKGAAATVFPFTQRRYEWIIEKCDAAFRRFFAAGDANTRSLIAAGAKLLLATDAGILAADVATDPVLGSGWAAPGTDNLAELGQGHFHWLKAMEEKGFPPMEGLKAATRNIAVAYRKDEHLGTLEAGKIADLLILNENPLLNAENYRSIHLVMKDGVVVDRSSLPKHQLLTKAPPEPTFEERAYRAQRAFGTSRYPSCC